jgi:hypothetical protein
MSADKVTLTAHHEAAHAVITYRVAGHAERLSIVAQPDEGLLGSAQDGTSDSFSEAHMEARVLSCYAGGHAQRMLDPDTGNKGCDHDDEIADDLLRRWGWEPREQALRDRSAELVSRHWIEIVAVAEELLRCQMLDETEVEILADGAAGDPECDNAALAMYRKLKEGAR